MPVVHKYQSLTFVNTDLPLTLALPATALNQPTRRKLKIAVFLRIENKLWKAKL